MEKISYDSLVEAVADLEKEGYTHDFHLDNQGECLVCHKTGASLSPEEFKIDAVYRFYSQSDPDDETILYAVSSDKFETKGLLINAFGIYGDYETNKLVEKLIVRKPQEVKPLKRHPALIKLSREHHFGLLLCWKIRQGIKNNIESERIASYILFFFDNDLEEHFKDEEENLLVKLSKDDSIRQQVETDHLKINRLITSIRTGNVSPALLSDLADSLDKHIRYEERIVFNYLQQKLSGAELEKLAEQHAAKPCDLDEKWADHFWKRNK